MSLIQNTDYRLMPYYKVPTYNTLGDLVKVQYFLTYDSQNDTYSNLQVEENITTTRDSLGLPTSRQKVIDWYIKNSVVFTKTMNRNYDSSEGYTINQVSRQRLIDNASVYLFGSLVAEYGVVVGSANAYEFLNDVVTPISEYVKGNRQLLVDAVNSSTRAYMTAQRKSDIVAILDVSYIPTP